MSVTFDIRRVTYTATGEVRSVLRVSRADAGGC